MSRINVGKVLLGGLVAGVVANILDYGINEYLMTAEAADMVQRLNLPADVGQSAMVTWIVVDFTQGIEYFNTLRRLEKPVVLLEYPGENHGLARPANQQDYTERMKEFFDHYLKTAPAPQWLEYGVPRLKMQEHIDLRLKERQEREKAKNPPAPAPSGGRGGGGSN